METNEKLEKLNEETKKKAEMVLRNISEIEKKVKNAIDDAVDSMGDGSTITVAEVQAALINTIKYFSNKEITNLILPIKNQ